MNVHRKGYETLHVADFLAGMQVQLLWRLPVFKGVSMTLLHEIAQIMERRTYHVGGLLFQQGDEADAMFVLTSGSVRIVREMSVTPAFAAAHQLV